MVKIYFKNVRSIKGRKKANMMFDASRRSENDLFILVETHLNENIQNSKIFCPKKFSVKRTDRKKNLNNNKELGGGVAIAFRKDKFECEEIILENTTEILAIKIINSFQKPLFLVACYARNASNDIGIFCHKNVLSRQLKAIREIVKMAEQNPVFICGDFNMRSVEYRKHEQNNYMIPENIKERHFKNFIESLNALGLEQINCIPNNNGKYLDLVFTNEFKACSVYKPKDVLLPDTEIHHTETVIEFAMK